MSAISAWFNGLITDITLWFDGFAADFIPFLLKKTVMSRCSPVF